MPFDLVTDPSRQMDVAMADSGPALLIDHIRRRYHEVHRGQFPEAIALARRVETEHRSEPLCPRGLGDHLAVMSDDLMSHQRREEDVLFPLMLAGGHPMIRHPISRMAEEHRDVDDQLERLSALTNGFIPPRDACWKWRALCRLCRDIAEDLREHMRLENEVLFPLFLETA